jgi:Tfp pilus assembly PilM family ATPase
MKKGRRSTVTLGIHFGSCSIRLVALERTRKGIQLKHCCERPFTNGLRFVGVFDTDTKNSCIQTLQSLVSDIRMRSKPGTVGLDSRNVILRRIPIDSWLKENELENQVLWDAEQLLVDPLDHYVLDFHIQDVNETTREVLLAVARKRTVQEYTDILHKSGIDPICVDVDLFALSNAYEHFFGNRRNGAIALVDVEPETVRCIIIQNGLLYFGTLSEMSPEFHDLSVLLDTATRQSGETLLLERVVLSGSERLSEKCITDLSTRYNVPVEAANPLQEMKTGSTLSRQQIQRMAPSYMINIGLALRGITET